jgi:sarcosine oxidase
VIDEHPENDAVLIVSACSGHGFKHSPAIGEAAARWATGERTATELDLSGFRLGLAMG